MHWNPIGANVVRAHERFPCGGEVFDDMIVERVFPPAKETWNTIYVTFVHESSVQILYNYTRHLQKAQRHVSYIPKQFYPRYKALESLAYNLRQSPDKYKTRVKMGASDLVLYKRKSNVHSWIAVPLPVDIPGVLFTNNSTAQLSSSPAPGRPYRTASHNSCSKTLFSLRPNSLMSVNSRISSQE